MFASRFFRQLIGILFCGAAGLSLVSMVLPSVVAAVGISDAFWARFSLSGYAAHIVLLWAVGGWGVARAGSMRTGGLIMGALGLVSGMVLSSLAIGTDPKSISLMAISSCGYGLTVGFLVGKVLENPQSG